MPKRSQLRLTKTLVEGLASRPTDYFAWDLEVPGFGVRVHTTGKRTFVLKYQLGGRFENGGRSRRLTLGDYPTLTVDEARRRAVKARGEALNGGDPQAAKLAKREELRAANQAPTVADLVEAYVKDCRALVKNGSLKAVTVDEYERVLLQSVLPIVGKVKARELTRADVRAMHEQLSDRPAAARRAVRVLAQSFNFAIDEQWHEVTASPCVNVLKAKGARRAPSSKVSLEIPQYAALGAALRTAREVGLAPDPALASRQKKYNEKTRAHLERKRGPYALTKPRELTPADPVQVLALHFAALTGWRRSEVFGLRWCELRLTDRTAVLGDSKTGRSVRPLGRVVMAILTEAAAHTRTHKVEQLQDTARVFGFGSSDAQAIRPEPRRLWRAVRHASKLSLRLHDLRHSWVTMGRRVGISDEIIGVAVGHASEGMTARYGDVAPAHVRRAIDDIASAIDLALRGEVATVKKLTAPKASRRQAS
jgi:integrase